MRLSELIQKYKTQTGRSFPEAAERAARAGYEIHRASLHRLATKDVREWPTPHTIQALSHAFDIPIVEITDAAAETLGLKIERVDATDPSVRAWVALTGDRTEEEVQRLLDVARSVADAFDTSSSNARDQKARSNTKRRES